MKNYFQLFLNSCKYNETIDWMIFTDDKEKYNYPKNVKVYYTTFEDTKKLFQSKFDFKIALETPYKLCDYKPTYGYIYEDYISDYDYWGFCDTDVIWGDLRVFFTDDLLDENEHIGFLGHCSLFKNTNINNRRFMEEIDKRSFYKEAFSTNEIRVFDENWGQSVNTIYKKKMIKSEFELDMLNINTKSSYFRMVKYDFKKERFETESSKDNYKNKFVLFDKGKLYRYEITSHGLLRKEYIYIHLQCRNMEINISNNEEIYKIIPNEFCKVEHYPINDSNIKKIKKYNLNLHYFKHRGKNLLNKLRKMKKNEKNRNHNN